MEPAEKPDPNDLQRLKQEIEELRRRITASAEKGKQLSWDTELLVKKTQNLGATKKVSCTNPEWREILAGLEIGPEGVCVEDVRTPEDIQFVAEFAGVRQLLMTYGRRSFFLEPREM